MCVSALAAPLRFTSESRAELIKALKQPDINELLKLGEIGYVDGIKAKLAEIVSADTESQAFVSKLRTLIGDMEIKQYMAILEEVRSSDD